MAAVVFFTFVALGALAGFALAVAWVRRSPLIGVVLVGLMVIPLWEAPSGIPLKILTLSGTTLYISDAIPILLFTVGILEVRQLRANLRGWIFPWVLFGVLIAFALLRGVLAFELTSTVNSARPLLYFFWSMTWVLAVRPDRLRLRTVSLVLGWMLVLVALYHGVTYGFGGSSSVAPTDGGVIQTGRILIAPQAMALLLCAATVFLGPLGSEKVHRWFYAFSSRVFGGVVVIAQHRSVWAAAALGLVAVLIGSGRRQGRKPVLGLTVLGAWALLLAWTSGTLAGTQILESASNRNTLDWRTTNWQLLISQAIASGPSTVVSGDPFGSKAGLRQMATTRVWTEVQAHNWYVTIFLYLGIVGLITYVTLLASALVKSLETPLVWTFVLAAIAVYGWAYSVDWYLVPWLGAAMAVSLGAGPTAEDTNRPAESLDWKSTGELRPKRVQSRPRSALATSSPSPTAH